MAGRPGIPSLTEAEPFCRIEFNFQISNTGTVTLHNADCSTALSISALKQDLESMFGPPHLQDWYLRSTLLEDRNSLLFYGLDGKERRTAKIFVRRASQGPN